jgi:hypothetical protein
MKPSLIVLTLVLASMADVAFAQRYAQPRPDRPRAPATRGREGIALANADGVRPVSFDEYVAQDEELAPGEVVESSSGAPPIEGDGVNGDYDTGELMDGGFGCDTCGDWCPGDCRRRNYLGPLHGGWASFDYLLWRGKGTQLPALVTTSPSNAPTTTWGVLGASDTRVLFGNERVDNGGRSGGRLDAGIWLDADQDFGVGLNFLGIAREATAFDASANSSGFPILGRPFFNEETGANDAQLVSQPDLTRGGIHVQTANTVLGVEAYLRERMLEEPGYQLDVLYGYRMLRIDESVAIYDTTTLITNEGIVPIGTELYGEDVFNTRNTFQGGQIGLVSRADRGCWGYDLLFKLAVGNIYQVANIRGNTVVSIPDAETFNVDSSLYAQPTNIGQYSRNVFGIIPELGVNLHYKFSPRWQFNVGYTFLYINNIQQAASAIDESVNPTQIDGPLVGPARPAFSFASDSYWLQGLNIGLECRF